MAKKQTLANHLVATVGFRKAVRVVAFLAAWGDFMETHGRRPRNVEEFAVLTGGSGTQAYRDLKVFRQAFPNEADPSAIWERLRETAQAKTKDRGVMALQLGSVEWR